MPLPISGPLTLLDIQNEFGGTNPIALSEYYRGGGLVPDVPANATVPTSGAIAIGNFYGTTKRVSIALTISANTYNYDVYANRGPFYIAGISDIVVTVNGGVTVGSTSTGAYALSVLSSFAAGDMVTIINNGVIQGMGGAGGTGGSGNTVAGSPGGGGGPAIYINRPTTITNNSVIAGGGGGGGGGGGLAFIFNLSGGGGGGGGAGFNGGSGGAGGTANQFGTPGAPGGGGTSASGGGGGAGGGSAGAGGAGGGRGAAGANGVSSSTGGGAGGSAGYYLVGNSFVTWNATGTRQGLVA